MRRASHRPFFPLIPVLCFIACILQFASFPYSLRAEIPSRNMSLEDTARLFLDLVHFNRAVFTGNEWVISEKDGAKTVRPRSIDAMERDVTYTIDRRNWYFSEIDQDAMTVTREAGLYFKKDRTPVVAVSMMRNDGYKECGSVLKFFEVKYASRSDGKSCDLKDVTGDIFPAIDIASLINNGPAVRKLFPEELPLSKIKILYRIPRIGTTITATVATTGIALRCREDDCRVKIKALSKFGSVRINWMKDKGKFEIGSRDPGLITLYEN